MTETVVQEKTLVSEPPDTPAPSAGRGFLALVELGGRVLLVVLSVFYVLGFVVENMHLARYGYFDLTLFERRYALAGFWALSPLVLFFLYMRLVEWSGSGFDKSKNTKKARLLRFTGGLVILSLMMNSIQTAFRSLLDVEFSWLWLPFIYGTGITWLIATRKAVKRWYELTTSGLGGASSPWTIARSVLGEVNWVYAVIITPYLALFTLVLFPTIPARWGGGGAERIQLVVPHEEEPTLKALGIGGDSAGLSAPVTLVASTADDYVLLVDTLRVVYLRRDVVRGVSLSGHFRSVLPIKTSTTPIDTMAPHHVPTKPPSDPHQVRAEP